MIRKTGMARLMVVMAIAATGAVLMTAGCVSRVFPVKDKNINGSNENPKTSAELWYVTVRNKAETKANPAIYGNLRGELHAGLSRLETVKVTPPERVADSSFLNFPQEKIRLKDTVELSHDRFWQDIGKFARNRRGKIVFYVHGYKIDFEKGCRQAVLFQRVLDSSHRLLLFSWPADGKLLNYTRDEADLIWSIPFLTEVLKRLVQCVGTGKLDVVAHSLGARGVVLALAKMACYNPPQPFLNELILLAPDIDSDRFKDIWPDACRLAQKTSLYVSQNDKALKISRKVHGYPRLGEAGKRITVLPDIETIDVSLIKDMKPSGHLYHLYSAEVIADLAILLNTGQRADNRPNLQMVDLNGLPYWRLIPDKP